MPKISVSPAASRNSSMPNCTPFRHCSMKYSMALFIAAHPHDPRGKAKDGPAIPQGGEDDGRLSCFQADLKPVSRHSGAGAQVGHSRLERPEPGMTAGEITSSG